MRNFDEFVKVAFEKEAGEWKAPVAGQGINQIKNPAQNKLISDYAYGKNVFDRDAMAKRLDSGIQKMQDKMKSFNPETSSYAQNIAKTYGNKIQNIENMKANILGTKPQKWAF